MKSFIKKYNKKDTIEDIINPAIEKIFPKGTNLLITPKRNGKIAFSEFSESIEIRNKLNNLFKDILDNEIKLKSTDQYFVKIDFSEVFNGKRFIETDFVKDFIHMTYEYPEFNFSSWFIVEEIRYKIFNKLIFTYNNLPTGIIKSDSDKIQLLFPSEYKIYFKYKPNDLFGTLYNNSIS